MEAICFDSFWWAGFVSCAVTFFSRYSTHFLFVLCAFCVEGYFFDYFGSLGSPCVNASFLFRFLGPSWRFSASRGCHSEVFWEHRVFWTVTLRVWGYPWADLVRSCCQRPPVSFTGAPFWTIFEPKWEPKGGQNGAQIPKKSVQNSIKKSMRFGIVFLLDFGWFLVTTLIEIRVKVRTHSRIKAKRPRAAMYCKYQYKLNVFWVAGIDFLTNFC